MCKHMWLWLVSSVWVKGMSWTVLAVPLDKRNLEMLEGAEGVADFEVLEKTRSGKCGRSSQEI